MCVCVCVCGCVCVCVYVCLSVCLSDVQRPDGRCRNLAMHWIEERWSSIGESLDGNNNNNNSSSSSSQLPASTLRVMEIVWKADSLDQIIVVFRLTAVIAVILLLCSSVHSS